MKNCVGTNLMTVDDVCRMYGVHRTTVCRWVRLGWLKATHIGKRVFFTQQACVAFEHRKVKR